MHKKIFRILAGITCAALVMASADAATYVRPRPLSKQDRSAAEARNINDSQQKLIEAQQREIRQLQESLLQMKINQFTDLKPAYPYAYP